MMQTDRNTAIAAKKVPAALAIAAASVSKLSASCGRLGIFSKADSKIHGAVERPSWHV
jgi:hypothetical protein